MNTQTIDTAMAKRLVEASAISGASIIGQPGGWSVVLKLGALDKTLGAQRSDKPRMWRSLDRCVDYLKKELRIARFDLLDATHYSDAELTGTKRADASSRLRRAHEAAVHDKWFRAQVGQAVQIADGPNAEWVSDEDANKRWAKKRAAIVKRTEGSAA